MKTDSVIILAILLLLCSCAHKSGHSGRNTSHARPRSSVSAPVVQRTSGEGGKLEGNQVFNRYHSAVFMVYTTDGTNIYQGSGFFIDNNGLAVSNYHVFQNAQIGMEAIKLEGDDTAYQLTEIYAADADKDFILFRVGCGSTNFIPIASGKPNIGDRVYAIGSPRGLENTFSSGDISQWRDEYVMQINAAIDHGSSGGALINEYGEVVGITSGTLYEGSLANLNYAWSIEVVKPFLSFR